MKKSAALDAVMQEALKKAQLAQDKLLIELGAYVAAEGERLVKSTVTRSSSVTDALGADGLKRLRAALAAWQVEVPARVAGELVDHVDWPHLGSRLVEAQHSSEVLSSWRDRLQGGPLDEPVRVALGSAGQLLFDAGVYKDEKGHRGYVDQWRVDVNPMQFGHALPTEPAALMHALHGYNVAIRSASSAVAAHRDAVATESKTAALNAWDEAGDDLR